MYETHTITEVTKLYGISTRTLRYYEQVGLITSMRVEGYAYRVYDDETCVRLYQILILRKLRIPLKQIAALLFDNSVINALGMFVQHIGELDEEIATLSTIRGILQTFADRLRENPNININADMLNDERLLSVFASLSLIKNNFREDKIMFNDGEADSNQVEMIQGTEDISKFLTVDHVLLLFGHNLIPLVDKNQGGDLLERIVMMRRQIALEKGMIIPVVRLKDDIRLRPSQYTISIKDVEAAQGEIMMEHYMAIPGIENIENVNARDIEGIETTEPCWGSQAFWIPESQCGRAQELGCTVIEPVAVLATHLMETIRRHLHVLLTLQDVQKLVDHVKEDNPVLIDELIPKYLSLNNVKHVLSRLLKEGSSIRDMVTILESLLDYAPTTKDMDMLVGYVQKNIH